MKQGNVRFMVTRAVFGLALTLCVLVSSSFAAEVYKWTDENGVTHFSQTPPPSGQEAEVEDIPEFVDEDSQNLPANENLDGSGMDAAEPSAADLRRQELAAARSARAQQEAETAALCQATQQRLAQIEPSRRVFYTNEDGETVRMDDEERVAEVEQLKEILNQNCQ